jgi:hypothetical protein
MSLPSLSGRRRAPIASSLPFGRAGAGARAPTRCARESWRSSWDRLVIADPSADTILMYGVARLVEPGMGFAKRP